MSDENKKLNIVKEDILAKMTKLGESLDVKRAGVLDVRKEMWREARIVLRDFDDVADLSIFAEEVARHEGQYVQASEEIKKLGKMLDSPYFARIDFLEDGVTDEIYIGRHSLFDDGKQAFHVYDWRAPISGMYYDFGTGAASFTVPATGVVISGEITLKRQYQIEKGELVYLFDNEIAIEDDILRLELSKASEARIKAIVNTIQADQNRAIRAEAGSLLVYGPAGCGKTSVGLHRLAYLLYRHRNSLSSAKVRIFSPNAIFSSYIAGIIPELGEEDVQTLDFENLLKGKFHSPYQMIEQLESPDDNRTKWLKIKFSEEFINSLENLIANFQPTFEDVIFYNDKLCDRGRLKSLYEDRTTQGTLFSKTERVINYVNQCYTEYFKAYNRKITDIFNDIHDENFSDGDIRAKFEEEKNIALMDIRNRSYPAASRIYEKFMRGYAKKAGASFTYARDALRMEKLFFEDALMMFYINLLLGRVKTEKTVKHILIDEAQDLSILHHRILKKLYPKSNFTVLADANQALYPEINVNNTDALIALYPQAQIIPLTKSYRSTYEIMNFAAQLIGQENPGAFLRNGEAPTIIENPDPIAATLDILTTLSPDYNTVGILLPTQSEAVAFYEKFKNHFPKENAPRPLNFINADSAAFPKGIMIMAAAFAKGLEFDVVICPAFIQPQTTAQQKLMYLICTRSLHRLFLVQ
ncbi:MAG: UvrD-helicase domain-containing protein [Defluviitaleaceae bacterium]|nr:UvrD-helicase domain-containing protein [Defluviitaleaceae bacterium]